jgi:hypothetical protein
MTTSRRDFLATTIGLVGASALGGCATFLNRGTRTKTGAWSTGADVLESLADQGIPLARTIVDWRQLTKLIGTYTDALPAYINQRTGRVHTTYSQHSVLTGRLSSNEPTSPPGTSAALTRVGAPPLVATVQSSRTSSSSWSARYTARPPSGRRLIWITSPSVPSVTSGGLSFETVVGLPGGGG